jgi:hypothetical protein
VKSATVCCCADGLPRTATGDRLDVAPPLRRIRMVGRRQRGRRPLWPHRRALRVGSEPVTAFISPVQPSSRREVPGRAEGPRGCVCMVEQSRLPRCLSVKRHRGEPGHTLSVHVHRIKNTGGSREPASRVPEHLCDCVISNTHTGRAHSYRP